MISNIRSNVVRGNTYVQCDYIAKRSGGKYTFTLCLEGGGKITPDSQVKYVLEHRQHVAVTDLAEERIKKGDVHRWIRNVMSWGYIKLGIYPLWAGYYRDEEYDVEEVLDIVQGSEKLVYTKPILSDVGKKMLYSIDGGVM